MNDPGPLRGPDITGFLTSPTAFGVTGAASPDGIRTIELTSEPSIHGAHGSVRVRLNTSTDSALSADVSWGRRGHVQVGGLHTHLGRLQPGGRARDQGLGSGPPRGALRRGCHPRRADDRIGGTRLAVVSVVGRT
jgi:hypothetical protein